MGLGVRLGDESRESRDSCKVWNMFMFEYWRIGEVLRYSKRHTPSVLWCSSRTRCVKYETCSWSNTDAANVKYWGPIPKLVYLQNCVQTTECNTFPLLIPWIPDKTHPKEKNYQDMHVNVIPTKGKQLPWWHLHWTLYWANGFSHDLTKIQTTKLFSWDFIFMMHKSCWQQLISPQGEKRKWIYNDISKES